MNLKEFGIKQALSKAYRLITIKRPEIDIFKKNLINLLGQIDERESEENVKFHLMTFLRDTFYHSSYLLATKGKTDFVIHMGKDASFPSGTLFEVKRPLNTADMVSRSNLNTKAMHELVLYYLRERIEHKNNDIRHLVITNIYEWFIFDAVVFEKLFHKNAQLVKHYREWTAKQKVSVSTELFYNEIAKPFLASLNDEISFTWFDIRSFEKPLKNGQNEDDIQLIGLFKILSPFHLLKLDFASDSNNLDKGFYTELLHIIGLEEVKEGSKKIIRRKEVGKRDEGSILENAIMLLETENCLHKIHDLKSYGENQNDQLFSVGLELCITWINRILFLKLLEAQLLKYHNNDGKYRFLNYAFLPHYDEVYKLFFQVLARPYSERSEKIQTKFRHIPYLNSSLFDFSDLEDATIKINMLDDSVELNLLSYTILRNEKDKPKAEKLNALQYLFEFLNAYNFSSEGGEEIQEESKTLINASVLGLIFEKINGYKDGSIFTPGFITMYMCRQSIRGAIINKFKESYNWKIDNFADLYNYIAEDRSVYKLKEYNSLINTMTICDPAVGSGHFLVSALNELISIKADLGILISEQGQRLSEIEITLENDELIITDAHGDIFKYIIESDINKNNYIQSWKQTVQKTLFHEKQTIIEKCLFGVDTNYKSVQICRLRLWIELLKNAYYINSKDQLQTNSKIGNELQTLPNIDINIKCGNSLISRFGLTEDLKSVTPYFEKKILEYKLWVAEYKHEIDKDKKRGIQQLMIDLKRGFLSKITNRNPTKIKLDKLTAEFLNKYVNEKLFSSKLTPLQKKDKDLLDRKILELNNELEAYLKNPIFSNAFEWRFEFPEVLNDKGDFMGFDLIIANPPYVQIASDKSVGTQYKSYLIDNFGSSMGRLNTFGFFIVLGIRLAKSNGILSYIVPNTILMQDYYEDLRKNILSQTCIRQIVLFDDFPFKEAVVENVILQLSKTTPANNKTDIIKVDKRLSFNHIQELEQNLFNNSHNSTFKISSSKEDEMILEKIGTNSNLVKTFAIVNQAIALKGDRNKWVTDKKIGTNYKKVLIGGKNINRYGLEWDGSFLHYTPEAIHSCKREDIFLSNEKILFRRVSDKIIATIDSEKYFGLHTLVVVNLKENAPISLKVLVAFLNSNVLNYYFKKIFSSTKTVFSEIGAKQVELLPIRTPNETQNLLISSLVSKALLEKSRNFDADISTIEVELNNIIYSVYDLSEVERDIINESIKAKAH